MCCYYYVIIMFSDTVFSPGNFLTVWVRHCGGVGCPPLGVQGAGPHGREGAAPLSLRFFKMKAL